MASLNPKAPATRLYLMTPPIQEATAFAPSLSAALATADVAAVLLRLAESDERSQINVIKSLAALVQAKDVALVLDGHPTLVARGGADGAQLSGIEPFSAALETLKPARIVGCGGLASRHDAMVAAEQGADYVMFGDVVDGRRPSFDAIVERVTWWVEVFEVPCVALAESADELAQLAAAGADFIAVGEFIWNDTRGVAAALESAAARLTASVALA